MVNTRISWGISLWLFKRNPLFPFLHSVLERQAENHVLRISGNGAFVLPPQERPVVEVLEMVGLAEEQTWGHIARYEREVGAVVAIEYGLRTSGTYSSHQ